MEDLKQQYFDEMKHLINSDNRDEIKIDELKENFNGMSIEIRKKEKLQQLDQWANLSTSLSKRFNSFCYDDDDDDDDEDEYTIAATPSLPTEEPDNSLSMEDEHLDTIPATESDEFIKSSVENLIPIPSEFEGIPEHMCDVPFHDNSPHLDVSKDQFEVFSDSNDEFSSTDDDSFSIDKIDYVEASPPDSKLVGSEVKENQEKDKIESKPDKNGKRGEAKKSLKQLQCVEHEKLSKTQKEWPKTQAQSKAIQPQFPLPFKSKPGYNENYTSYPYDSSSLPQKYLCCTRCEVKIAELTENFNGMSIKIQKKEKLLQQEQWAYRSTHPSKRLNSFCYDDDDDEDYTSVITPDEPILSTEEPNNSLCMGDEHLDTIPATESNEFINSGVENLIPIPSKDCALNCKKPDNIYTRSKATKKSQIRKQLNSTLAKITEQMTSITSLCEMACQFVQQKLEEKQLEEERAAKAQNWKLPVCYDDDDDEEICDSLNDNLISGLPPFSAITHDEPVLSTEEPDNSLSMGDEHLDTIPATKSDEFIKSGVETLISIPSESEGIPDHMCDVPSHENSPPLDVSKDTSEDLSESNEEFSSTNDDSFCIDNINYVEASPPDSELVSSEVMEIVIPEVGGIKASNDNPILFYDPVIFGTHPNLTPSGESDFFLESPVIHQPPQELSIQEMEDLKHQYLDELKCLSNLEYRDEIKISELTENFNGMSIEIQKKEKLLQQEQWAYLSTHPSKRLHSFFFYDDDEDYTSAITPNEPVLSIEEPDNSLSMGDEHLDTILATESDEFIKSGVENLITIPSESEEFSSTDDDSFSLDNIDYVEASPPDSELISLEVMEIVIPEVGGIKASNDNPILFYDPIISGTLPNLTPSGESEFFLESCSDEDVLEKIVSKPLFEEEIIPMESLRTHDSSLLISSKIDSLIEEFAGELTLLKSIPPGIDETDCDFEEDIRLIEKLLYDNSSPRPPEEFVSANSDAKIKSFSPSPILVKDSDLLMEEIDLFCTLDYPMPSGIVDKDYDSERDILILKDLPSNNTLSFA
nr:hypothetical protein [Tanacetum cinerariifolium]